ncbi:hypothetical protein QYE76_052364 [Lolium multiflorum]|uniref:CCHC-type domain-containing protein n=1 Tax=Lolium multiflorum TaxID=4521 RepID=A0AAD8SUK6_LOLMU|nr:hypothetical protein QYE76_052364 [Lolium multiflorum]
MMTWEDFKLKFSKYHVPQGLIKKMRDEFRELKQGRMSVVEYRDRFLTLSRYAPDETDTNEKRKERFLNGLHDEMQTVNNNGGPPKPGGNNNNNNNHNSHNNNGNNTNTNTGPRTGSNAIPVTPKDKSTVNCYECGVVGHYSKECPKKLAKIAANTAAPAQQQRFAGRRNQNNNNGRFYHMTATEAQEAPQTLTISSNFAVDPEPAADQSVDPRRPELRHGTRRLFTLANDASTLSLDRRRPPAPSDPLPRRRSRLSSPVDDDDARPSIVHLIRRPSFAGIWTWIQLLGGTFMSITLGAATKLLDDMMINYSEWHTERTPQGKKVNSVEETSSLGDKIDAIMSMLANGRSHIDPNNVPLASLVAQEENVDVNLIKSNNFNNNAYRNNYGNNNFRPYPSNSNGYGNSYGNSYNNNKSVPSGLEAMLKEFISTQTAFNKTVEEKLGKIDILASKVDSLALDVDLLKLKVMPEKVEDARFAKTNAIQVRINDNIRLLAELHARWDREEKEKLAKENNVAKVWTITTTSNVDSSHVAAPPTINGKIIGVGNVSTPSAKRTKLLKLLFVIKLLKFFKILVTMISLL